MEASDEVLGTIGYGAYRVSIENKSHLESLKYAINCGCRIIDTAPNYSNGDSEKLIGEILKNETTKDLKIITKVGYLDDVDVEIFKDYSYLIKNEFYFSIHPKFIEYKISKSLERMKIDSVFCMMLHNPEYLFSEMDEKSVYEEIKKSFQYLETLVKENRIQCYGISSNLFAEYDQSNYLKLEKVLAIANEISEDNQFKFIQFPFNIYEVKALELRFGNQRTNLFEFAKSNGIKTIINRPFIGSVDKKPIKIVVYSNAKDFDLNKNYFDQFNRKLKEITNSINSLSKEIEDFLKENWINFKSEKLLRLYFQNILYKYFEEANITTMKDFNEILAEFYHGCLAHIKYRITIYNLRLKEQILNQNPEFSRTDSFAATLIKLYRKQGADIVLTGMRKIKYVEEMKTVFQENEN